MNALILDYFGDWRTRPLTCPTCGWTGSFREGWNETYGQLEDCRCPGEHGSLDRPMLAVLPFPTLEEYRQNWEKLSGPEQDRVEAIEAGLSRFERGKLKTADQLPDLDEPVLDLLWDLEGDEVVLRLGARALWREPARYEALWRFEQVLALLQAKYGPRLRDLEPTRASQYHLYGDKIWYPDAIDCLRAGLRKAWEAAQNLG